MDDKGRPIVPQPLVYPSGLLHYLGSAPAVQAITTTDYTGDGTNNRVIDVGIAADMVLIFPRDNRSEAFNHLGLAYAVGNAHGVFYHDSTDRYVKHESMLSADDYFKGIHTGTTIQGGSSGSDDWGINANAREYRALAFKFA